MKQSGPTSKWFLEACKCQDYGCSNELPIAQLNSHFVRNAAIGTLWISFALVCDAVGQKGLSVSGLFWFTDEQIEQIKPSPPKERGVGGGLRRYYFQKKLDI